jgi:hypothetical protein
MFFIVNKTKSHISLPDINISLGPRQAMDLDRIMKREISENSRHLRAARANGDVEIRVKDEPKKQIDIQPDIAKPDNNNDLKQFKDEILKEMKDMLSSLSTKDKGESVSKEELLEVLKSLGRIQVKENTNVVANEEDILVGEDLLSKINARTVDKMLENTSVKSVHYEEIQEDDNLLHNIGELEDLLG